MYQFIIFGYETKLENGTLTDAVEVYMVAKTEVEAIKKGKKLVKRTHWVTRKIQEFEKHPDYLSAFKDMTKALRDMK